MTEGRPPASWSLGRRIAFRFLFSYFVLYSFSGTSLIAGLPFGAPLIGKYFELWQVVAIWIEKHVLHLGYEIGLEAPGINNTAFGWILMLCSLAVAALAAAVWSVLDRRRLHYERLHSWLRLGLRLMLAAAMIRYGCIKLIPSQMIAPPPLGLLTRPVGDFPPYHLLWWFIGSSPNFESFIGFAELLGGVLLLVPRTTLLGALVCSGDMLVVFMLNMSYDVSVKIPSLHLLVMSLILLAPDLTRLANVFLFNRRAEPAAEAPLFARKWLHRIPHVLLFLFGLYAIRSDFADAAQRYKRFHPPRPPLYGIWNVEKLTLDGRDVPLYSDPERWRRVRFQVPGAISIELMTGSGKSYPLGLDMARKRMRLGTYRKDSEGNLVQDAQPQKGPGWQAELTFAEPQPGVLILDGRLEGRQTRATLRKMALIGNNFGWLGDPLWSALGR
ncbi:MAG TPA: hypothetical protein VE078_07675 [Thermoanaerobaculia bacterium]|nr:hypothetical protein [Thermoanaerobaculia bacterium]